MSSLEFSRRQLFQGGLATLLAGNFGFLDVGVRIVPSVVPSSEPLSPFGDGNSDALTRMILDLMDEELMHPTYFTRSSVRLIFREASEPGVDAKQVILKCFPDEAIESTSETGNLFAKPSPIMGSSRKVVVAGEGDVASIESADVELQDDIACDGD